MNITTPSHAKYYLIFLWICNLAKAVVQVMLVADILFIAMLRTLKSILCSQDGVFLKLCFIKLELIKNFFKIKVIFRLGGKINIKFFLKKSAQRMHTFPCSFQQPFEFTLPCREGAAHPAQNQLFPAQGVHTKDFTTASQVPTKVEQRLDPHH